jgi:hypothetical protein
MPVNKPARLSAEPPSQLDADDLWSSVNPSAWSAALAAYPTQVAAQGSPLLDRLDPWYRLELPAAIRARSEAYATRDELVRIVEWKMARGVWRARNLHLARSNAPEDVETASRAAFAVDSDDRAALKALGALKGVGPATVSAILAAHYPARYPFFDDVVAAQVPGLRPGEFTAKAYLAYAAALRARAAELGLHPDGRAWTPQDVGLALWSYAGGKGV